MTALRPYQHDILTRQHAAAKRVRRLLVVLATGLGKTEIALANIVSAIQRGFRVVYIAHREELITQPAERLARRGIPYGVLKAGHPEDLRKPVQVASVQTLAARRHLLPRLGEGKLLVYDHERVQDLIQAGVEGLIHSLQKYDPEKGIALTTYAGFWCRAYITRHLLRNWRLVRWGKTNAQVKIWHRLWREEARLLSATGEASPAALAECMGVTEQEVMEALTGEVLGVRDRRQRHPHR